MIAFTDRYCATIELKAAFYPEGVEFVVLPQTGGSATFYAEPETVKMIRDALTNYLNHRTFDPSQP